MVRSDTPCAFSSVPSARLWRSSPIRRAPAPSAPHRPDNEKPPDQSTGSGGNETRDLPVCVWVRALDPWACSLLSRGFLVPFARRAAPVALSQPRKERTQGRHTQRGEGRKRGARWRGVRCEVCPLVRACCCLLPPFGCCCQSSSGQRSAAQRSAGKRSGRTPAKGVSSRLFCVYRVFLPSTPFRSYVCCRCR
jgi:hypothetical protein